MEAQWVQLPQLWAHAEAHPGEYTQVGATRGDGEHRQTAE